MRRINAYWEPRSPAAFDNVKEGSEGSEEAPGPSNETTTVDLGEDVINEVLKYLMSTLDLVNYVDAFPGTAHLVERQLQRRSNINNIQRDQPALLQPGALLPIILNWCRNDIPQPIMGCCFEPSERPVHLPFMKCFLVGDLMVTNDRHCMFAYDVATLHKRHQINFPGSTEVPVRILHLAVSEDLVYTIIMRLRGYTTEHLLSKCCFSKEPPEMETLQNSDIDSVADIRCMAANGHRLAVARSDGDVFVWDTESNEIVWRINVNIMLPEIAFVGTRRIVLFDGSDVSIFEIMNEKPLHKSACSDVFTFRARDPSSKPEFRFSRPNNIEYLQDHPHPKLFAGVVQFVDDTDIIFTFDMRDASHIALWNIRGSCSRWLASVAGHCIKGVCVHLAFIITWGPESVRLIDRNTGDVIRILVVVSGRRKISGVVVHKPSNLLIIQVIEEDRQVNLVSYDFGTVRPTRYTGPTMEISHIPTGPAKTAQEEHLIQDS